MRALSRFNPLTVAAVPLDASRCSVAKSVVCVLVEDYPRDQLEFESRFASEEACRDYLFALRWPDGFRCPGCGHERAWPVRKVLFNECARCGRQTSVTAGTILQDTRKPLRLWFRPNWLVTSQKHGASALGLQLRSEPRQLPSPPGLGHKLRRAMVRPGRERLTGVVEVRRAPTGALRKRALSAGRSSANVDCSSRGGARRRVGTDPHAARRHASAASLMRPSSRSRSSLGQRGCDRRLRGLRIRSRRRTTSVGSSAIKHHREPASRVTAAGAPGDLTTQALAAWHTPRGGQPRALDYYLDEFVFRFNRRCSRSRGKLFYTAGEQAVAVEPMPYRSILAKGDDAVLSPTVKILGSPESSGYPASLSVEFSGLS